MDKAALLALADRVAACTPEEAEHDYLGVQINEALEIASYITDDGDPTQSLDAALALIPADAFWRVGHDGEGPDPSLFAATVGVSKEGECWISFRKAVAETAPLALTAAALRARASQ